MSGERHTIDTPLGQLMVRVRGQGPAALLWHSLFVDDRSWARVEEELACDRQLVLVTGPGHGQSSAPRRRYTLEECATAADAVLAALDIAEPVDWLGNAWGGHVGMVFAAGWPARCRTLVTIGSPVQALSASERARTHLLLVAHRLLGPASFIQEGVADVLLSARTRAQDPDAVGLVRSCVAGSDRARLRNAVVSISLHRPDLAATLPRIGAPTLFITGDAHKGWTPRQATAASLLLPHGTCAVISDAAYLAPLESPRETTRLIRQFWAAHVPVRSRSEGWLSRRQTP